MHLHFVQSLEPVYGAGLGQSALSLHLAMLEMHKKNPSYSTLLTTRASDFTNKWPHVIQGVRIGPSKPFWAPTLKHLAKEAVSSADWFHGHGLYVWLNFWLGGEARRHRKRLVYHPHGFFDPWILRRSVFQKKLAKFLFEDANFKHVTWWRALSLKEARQIKEVVGSKVRVHIIPNGIDFKEVDQATSISTNFPTQDIPVWMNAQRPKRLLFLSRIHPKKGLDILIQAWGILTREFPDWELLIVGPNENGYQRYIEKMIASVGCYDSCSIQPPVVGVDKHLLLRSSNLFVLPSYSEGFPMVILEAAANGLPVVQTDECNFPELTAASAAWECRAELSSLCQVLREAIATDDSEREERGAKGRQLVEKLYTWQNIAELVARACKESGD